jgi:hypothetical protein
LTGFIWNPRFFIIEVGITTDTSTREKGMSLWKTVETLCCITVYNQKVSVRTSSVPLPSNGYPSL